MWRTVTIRHDNSLLRCFEHPLMEHIAEEFNKIETQHGKITMTILVQEQEDKWAEFLVRTEQ